MPHPSQYFNRPRTSPEKMMREWMARQTEANERIKNQYLKKIPQTKPLPHTTNKKPKHEFVYQPPSIRNDNDKGDVKFIEEDEIKPIPTMSNSKPINSNSPTVSPFLKYCTVHIPNTNAKTFANDVLPNHVGDDELKSIDSVGTGKMKKKKDKGMPKEPNKEWKFNEKAVPHNEDDYHYQWHPTEIPHLNRIIKES
ncbi:hypothetical protein Tco_1066967 [Tanacetum coccineum]|uniref:Uncharacterized protein n=1 Tax=Tanacetum coccineum TaxID=301880 RepID=A0ABQ5HBI7_9ASTR